MQGFALALIAAGKFEEAEPLAKHCYEQSKRGDASGQTGARTAEGILLKLYEAWGRPEKAAEYGAVHSEPER
jgi:hypothetical protein